MNLLDTLSAAIVSFVLGGGLIGYLKYQTEKSKDDRSLLKDELELYKTRYQELRHEIDALSTLMIPSAAPEWRKNHKGEYEYISPSYEIGILLNLNLTKDDVIGKTDKEVFKSYPDFVSLLRAIEDEARKSQRRFAVRYNVVFPGNPEQTMVIKEIAQSIAGKNYYIGRCYPYHEQTKQNDKGKQKR